MRRPINKINVKSLVICAAILAGIFLVEIVCAYAFVEDYSFRLDATAPERQDSEDSGNGDSKDKDSEDANSGPGENEYDYLGVQFDQNAVNGMIDPSEKTGDKKDYGTIAFKINPKPVFKNAKAEGELMIENHGDNQHLIKVRIELVDETAEEDPQIVYESGYLAPDMHIQSAKLDAELEKGEYNAMAYIEAYDMETLEMIGELEQEITIKISK